LVNFRISASVAFVVDVDAVVGLGPLVALSRATPGFDEISGRIEREHRRRSAATFAYLELQRLFVIVERGRTAMNDPDIVLIVHPDPDGRSEQPVIRQRLRPKRVDLERRRLDSAPLRIHPALQYRLPYRKREDKRENSRANVKVTPVLGASHDSPPFENTTSHGGARLVDFSNDIARPLLFEPFYARSFPLVSQRRGELP
jgi:hypothetical protein